MKVVDGENRQSYLEKKRNAIKSKRDHEKKEAEKKAQQLHDHYIQKKAQKG